MGKPRMIILVRHAQSEGNKNRDIHQFIPDHRVKLTADGQNQAEEAGRRLRSMLKPDDTLQFFTSPYRRTRETTEGILKSLTSDDPTPSPFPRHKIKVFEEPRLREQDFGNFQPCSAEMERMWQERADYGHFFYRIPSGESAADAYDRVSGFNESMWRLFGEEDFPSVCVLVTHGLMTRVFLMKWYHWSVEYFEDLRNVNHCEFIVMKQNQSNGRYILQNELRTWSELKRRAASLEKHSASTGSLTSSKGPPPPPYSSSPVIPVRRWGGCADGCNHSQVVFPRRARRQNTADFATGSALPAPALPTTTPKTNDDPHTHTTSPSKISHQEKDPSPPTIAEPTPSKTPRKTSNTTTSTSAKPTSALLPPMPMSPNDASASASADPLSSSDGSPNTSEQEDAATTIPLTRYPPAPRDPSILRHLHPGRDFGGSRSGTGTPGEAAGAGGLSDDSDYFPNMHQHHQLHHHQGAHHGHAHGAAKAKTEGAGGGKQGNRFRASSRQREKDSTQSRERKAATRRMSEAEWVAASGMGSGARADALGDGDEVSDDLEAAAGKEREREKPILEEALKGCMEVEEGEEGDGEEEEDGEGLDERVREGKVRADEVERLKEAERCGFGEVY